MILDHLMDLWPQDQDGRKEEWKQVSFHLKKVMKKFPRSTNKVEALKIHKKLFVSGKIDQQYYEYLSRKGFRSGGPAFMHKFILFYLWYFPNLNNDSVSEILKVLEKYDSIRLVSDASSFYFKVEDTRALYTDYGLMGGKEKILARLFMLGRTENEDGYVIKGYPNPYVDFGFVTRIFGGLRTFLGKFYQEGNQFYYVRNPQAGCQYLWPEMSDLVQNNYSELFGGQSVRSEEVMESVNKYVNYVLFFDEVPAIDKDDEISIACRDRILSQFENELLADWLMEIFHKNINRGFEG